jgi:hypothetical protein
MYSLYCTFEKFGTNLRQKDGLVTTRFCFCAAAALSRSASWSEISTTLGSVLPRAIVSCYSLGVMSISTKHFHQIKLTEFFILETKRIPNWKNPVNIAGCSSYSWREELIVFFEITLSR